MVWFCKPHLFYVLKVNAQIVLLSYESAAVLYYQSLQAAVNSEPTNLPHAQWKNCLW